ncbi:MAG: FAD-binding oxidoreductase [SAR324 cluster bacterium]|nr:FAD-binding oxidoreductase [SAR324 cluster bacterium]
MNELWDQLKAVVGSRGYREEDGIDIKNYRDYQGDRQIRPRILLRPESTEEVSKIMKFCHQAGQAIAPQGGMTGLVSAAAPMEGEIALSFDRMNQIIELDPLTATITVEAGAPLQAVQEHAAKNGFLFPLDLGARGSCTIGGNLSTNAGGNRVIRYGMMRDLVLGVEAVLADGTIINGLHKLTKNNTGYDLKHLFIGTEGTLGIITRAVLKLSSQPRSQLLAFCGLKNFDAVAQLLVHMKSNLGGNLCAFEVIWQEAYQLLDLIESVKKPLPDEHGFYVLVESMGSSAKEDKTQFDNALESAFAANLLEDAVVSHSSAEVKDLWLIRDGLPEVPSKVGAMHSYDISLAVGDMGYFGNEVTARLRKRWSNCILALFGHIGDGNLHIIIHVGPDTVALHQEIDQIVYELTRELHGSISAEHGIGIMKRDFLHYSRSSEEIALMKMLKQTIDPKGILSPGRVVEI